MYAHHVKKRTSMLLDPELVAEAARALDTEGTTATVRAALEKAVRDARLRALAEWELPEDAPALLEEMRRPRF